MIRLDSETHAGRTTIRVDGSIDIEGAEELQRVCDTAAGPLTLDLANTNAASREGIAVILELVNRGAELRNVPPYIALRLEHAQ
jgi:hypothetical protein